MRTTDTLSIVSGSSAKGCDVQRTLSILWNTEAGQSTASKCTLLLWVMKTVSAASCPAALFNWKSSVSCPVRLRSGKRSVPVPMARFTSTVSRPAGRMVSVSLRERASPVSDV